MMTEPRRPANVGDLAPNLVNALANLEPDHSAQGILTAVLRLWPDVLHTMDDTMSGIVHSLSSQAATLRAVAGALDELVESTTNLIQRFNMQSDYVTSLEHRVAYLAGALTPAPPPRAGT